MMIEDLGIPVRNNFDGNTKVKDGDFVLFIENRQLLRYSIEKHCQSNCNI